jgi:hypothetical protein
MLVREVLNNAEMAEIDLLRDKLKNVDMEARSKQITLIWTYQRAISKVLRSKLNQQ